MRQYSGKQLADYWMPLAARLWSTQDCQTRAIAAALASAYRQGQAHKEPVLSDVILPTYCACNTLLKSQEQLEAHVARGCWRAA